MESSGQSSAPHHLMEAEPSAKCEEVDRKTLIEQLEEELGSHRESCELQSDEGYSCKEFSESTEILYT